MCVISWQSSIFWSADRLNQLIPCFSISRRHINWNSAIKHVHDIDCNAQHPKEFQIKIPLPFSSALCLHVSSCRWFPKTNKLKTDFQSFFSSFVSFNKYVWQIFSTELFCCLENLSRCHWDSWLLPSPSWHVANARIGVFRKKIKSLYYQHYREWHYDCEATKSRPWYLHWIEIDQFA